MNIDELIQKQMEEGSNPSGVDAEAYRVVFNSLKKEPAYKLSPDFASRVAARAHAPAKTFDWDKFFLIGGMVLFLAVLVYAIAVTQFTFSAGVFRFFESYSTLFVFGTVFIVALHLLEKKLLGHISTGNNR
ncbi:MAG: hypothetical protein HY015_10750 [Bacteroidetes bacterium]|nr:hypothetical protein [Bacteroidota bacterium]MBI3483428.1 hypothetical protein [Bacteroidota bacterium]